MVFVDDGRLLLYWFTFDKAGRPVWLQSTLGSVVDNKYQGSLSYYHWDWATDSANGGVLGPATVVGSVAVTFTDDPTRAAIAWQWDEAGTFGPQTECIRDFSHQGPTTLAANTAFTGAWSEAGHPGFGLFVHIMPSTATSPSAYAESATVAVFDDSGEPVWLFVEGQETTTAPPLGVTKQFNMSYVEPTGYPFGVPVTACSTNACGVHHPSGTYSRRFDSTTSMVTRVLVDQVAFGLTNFDRPSGGGTGTTPLSKLSAVNLILADRADCTVAAGSETCPITVNWSAGSALAKAYRVDLIGGQSTQIGTGSTGELVDALSAGARVQYELRDSAGAVLFRSHEVRAFGTTPEPTTLTLDRNQCIVLQGQSTCAIQVTWKADSAAYPGATLYRRVIGGGASILRISPSGSVTDGVKAGEQVIYEVRATTSLASTLLASSQTVTATLAGPSSVNVDRTQCIVLQGQTSCNISVTWSSDAKAYPQATLFRRSGASNVALTTSNSGTRNDALTAGESVVYELRASNSANATLLATSPTVSAAGASASVVTVDRTQCTVPQGQTSCAIVVTWSTDALAYPQATIFRHSGATNTALTTATSGTRNDALATGESVVYELRSSNSASATLLASSPVVTATSASASTVIVDRTQCTVLQGQSNCSITVTWSADAQLYPEATLFRHSGTSNTALTTASSGTRSDALVPGETVVYELRSNNSTGGVLLARSPTVTAASVQEAAVSVDATQCTVPLGQTTCSVSVTWSSDPQAYPQATLFRHSGSATVPLTTANSGTRSDALATGESVVYELHANTSSASTILAASPTVEALASPPAPDVTAPSTSQCSEPALGALAAGSTPGFPGTWWNPKRPGTGWALNFNDNGTLHLHWFTFDRAHRATWLTSADLPVSQADGTYRSPLYRASWDWSANRRSPELVRVGSVAISFFKDDPSRAALVWQWDEVGGDPSAVECIQDFARKGPETPQPLATNTAYSGRWYEQSLGLENSYEVIVAILPMADQQYFEWGTAALFDDNGQPSWLNLNGGTVGPAPSEFTSKTFSLASYTSSSSGYPDGVPTADCDANCIDGVEAGTFSRQFTSPVTMQARIALSGSATGLSRFDRPTTGPGEVTLVKTSARNLILVDRTECTAAPGQATCAIQVDWTADPNAYPEARAFRIDLTGVESPVLLGADATGSTTEHLAPGTRVQYELRASSSAGSSLLSRTPEVRAFGEQLQPSTITASPSECVVVLGNSCSIKVTWSVDPLAYPGATVFRHVGDVVEALHTAASGSLTNALDVGMSARYEVHKTSASGSEILATTDEVRAILGPDQDGPAATAPAPADPAVPPLDSTGDSIGLIPAEFRVNESGQVTYKVPLEVPTGSGGFQPDLALTYNSGDLDGAIGPGWSLESSSTISRCRPSVEAGDANVSPVPSTDGFSVWSKFCLDGQRLLPVDAAGLTYRTEIDTQQLVTITEGTATDPVAWKVERKDGTTLFLGGDTGTLIRDSRRLSWQTVRLEDRFHTGDRGLRFSYSSTQFDGWRGQRLLDRIDYEGGSVVLQYGPAASTETRYVAGHRIDSDRLLSRVEMHAVPADGVSQAVEVRRYVLGYESAPQNPNRRLLTTLTEWGRSESGDALVARNATTFGWADTGTTLQSSSNLSSVKPFAELNSAKFADIDGDGRADAVWHEEQSDSPDQLRVSFTTPTSDRGIQFQTGQPVHRFGDGFSDNRSWYLFDFDGDGRDDLLAATPSGNGGRWIVKLSKATPSARTTVFETLAEASNPGPNGAAISFDSPERASALFADINADGLPDLIVTEDYYPPGNKPKESRLFARYMRKKADNETGKLLYVFDSKTRLDITSDPELGCLDLTMSRHRPDSLDAFDVDGDGWSELSLVGLTTSCPTKGNGNGKGSVGSPQVYPVGVGATLPPQPAEVAPTAIHISRDPQYWFVLRNDGFKGAGPNRTQEFTTVSKITAGVASVGGSATEPRGLLQMVDINGDGVTDVATALYEGTSKNVWRFRLGDGRSNRVTQDLGCVLTSGNECMDVPDAERAFLADFDGDGRLDFWRPDDGKYRVHLWTGNGFDQTGKLSAYEVKKAHWQRFPVDLDGDGDLELLQISGFANDGTDNGEWSAARLAKHHQPRNLINHITNGLGSVTDIDYEPSTASSVYQRLYDGPQLKSGRGSAVFDVRTPMWVVAGASSSAPTSGNAGAMSHVAYRYAGLKMQAGGRGGLGFARVSTLDLQTSIEVITDYEQAFPLTGHPKRTITRRTDGWDSDCADFDSVDCMQYVAPSDIKEPSVTRLISLATSNFVWRKRGSDTLSGSLGGAVPIQVLLVRQQQSFYDAKRAESPQLIEWETHRETTSFEQDITDSGVSCPSGYDIAMNVCKSVVTRHGRGGQDGLQWVLDKTETSRFDYGAANSTDQRYGRLLRSSVTHTRGSLSTTRVATFDYASDTLVLEGEHVQPDGGQAQALHTYYQRDASGNVVLKVTCGNDVTTGAAPSRDVCLNRSANDDSFRPSNPLDVWRYARTEYDPLSRYVDRTYSVLARNGVPQETKVLEVSARNLLGQPKITVDANGVTVTQAYDSFGRVRFEKKSSGGSSTVTRRACGTINCAPDAVYRVQTEVAGAPTSWTYFDRLDRPVLQLKQGFSASEVIAVKTTYDALGRTYTVTEPYFAAGASARNPSAPLKGAAPYTRTQYDSIGRVTSVMRPDRSFVTTDYDGLQRTITMPTNVSGKTQTRIERSNSLGELVYVHEVGQLIYGKEDDGQQLRYAYTPTGQQASVSGVSASESVSATFDDLGRRRTLSDPDMGDWTYVVNAAGDIVAQAGPGGTCTAIDVDGAGRTWRRRDYTDATLDPTTGVCAGKLTHEAQWEYDSLQVGKLSSEWIKENGLLIHQRDYDYDAYSRPSGVTTEYDGGASRYVQRSTYDEFGRPFQQFFKVDTLQQTNATLTLPETGELFQYNAQGYQYLTRNAFPATTGREYFRVDSMNARGQVTRETRLAGAAIETERSFDLETGRLRTISTQSGVLQDLEYDYDQVGNVAWREDRSGFRQIREDFGYDGMQRLTSTDLLVNGVLTKQSVTYDPGADQSGNIASKSGIGNYVYGGLDTSCMQAGEVAAGPHAVTQAGTIHYCYDARGNMVRDTSGRQIRYTAFDLPDLMRHSGSQRKVQFAYGANRERIWRKDFALLSLTPDEITHYTGGAEVHQYKDSGVVEVKRYLGAILVVQRYESGTTTLTRDYMFTDALGSTHLVTDAYGAAKTPNGVLGFDPWGARRDPESALALSGSVLARFDTRSSTRHGYTGHEQVDSMGLIHMNGRIYDPVIGRFLQADSIVEAPNYGPSWNRYTYVFNNPLANVDPSGHMTGRQIAGIAILVVGTAFAPPVRVKIVVASVTQLFAYCAPGG